MHSEISVKQECIPVGCVLAARWPYAWVCFRGAGGVSPKKSKKKKNWGGGATPRTTTPPDHNPPEHPPCRTRPPQTRPDPPDQTPPKTRPPRPDTVPPGPDPLGLSTPPCGQTDACKNITLATTSLRPVNIMFLLFKFTIYCPMNTSLCAFCA